MTDAPEIPCGSLDISPILGCIVHLARTGDRRCRCKGEWAYIAKSETEIHIGSLKCTSCGKWRAWLTDDIAATVLAVVEAFGKPRTAIEIRTPAAFPSDAPAADTLASIPSAESQSVT
jgi:hypothetical protein